MIFELFVLILLAGSLIGMAAIIRRKIPLLLELSPEQAIKTKRKKEVFSNGILLQKILSKVRVLILKSDNKTNEWLKRLRQKSQENKTKFSDSYWDKLRK